jgi:hypothetical protein
MALAASSRVSASFGGQGLEVSGVVMATHYQPTANLITSPS